MGETTLELTFVRKGHLEWREAPRPVLKSPAEAIVRPLVAARCDGDALFLFHDYSRLLGAGARLGLIDKEVRAFGAPPFAGPFAYGHECVAEVLEVGEGVRGVRAGDRVVVPWAISCGACASCSRGLTSHCERTAKPLAAYGFGGRAGGWGGAVSDALRVPYADAMLVPVPAGTPALELASASDNLTDAFRCVAPALAAEPGAPVLVVGGAAASIGLYAAGLSVALGSERVDYLDADPRRLSLAAALGANPLPSARRFRRRDALPVPARYPISVEASSSGRGLRTAVLALAPGGVCTSVGYHFRSGTRLPLFRLFLTGVRLELGVANARASLPGVLELVAAGRFRPSRLETAVHGWEDASEALLDRSAAKVVVARRSILDEAARDRRPRTAEPQR